MTLDKPLHHYLPAIYQSNGTLPEFLSAFAEHFRTLNEGLTTIAQRVTPADATDLDWLASWVALDLAEDWDEAKKRRLLGSMLDLYRIRGTMEGLKRYLESVTNLQVTVDEIETQGSFQIGITSRIGGFTKAEEAVTDDYKGIGPSLPRLYEQMTGVNHSLDYYLISRKGEITPYRVFLADQIKQIATERQPDGSLQIIVTLATGEVLPPYTNATIIRRDDLPGPRIFNDDNDILYLYHGDPIAEVATPYTIGVSLSGPSIAGLVSQLAHEKIRLMEALFAGQRCVSRQDELMGHLTREVRTQITQIVGSCDFKQIINGFKGDRRLKDQAISHLAGQMQRAMSEIQQAEPLWDDQQLGLIAKAFIDTLSGEWPADYAASVGRASICELDQQPEFVPICSLQLTEFLLQMPFQLQQENVSTMSKAGAPITEIQKYLSSSVTSQRELVRAVINREKPAHVDYVLHFQEEKPMARPAMQIGIHSLIGVSTIMV